MKEIDVLALDGKLLKTFLAVFQAQSVTRAAQDLGSSQSAVSHSLDRLRQYIGDPLFVKKGRGIMPTGVALSIAPKVSRIISDIEGLTLHTEYQAEQDEASFTIATNVTELLPILVPIKKAIRGISREVSMRFIELGARKNAQRTLNEGLADVAITASIGGYPLELSSEQFYSDDIYCFYDASQRTAPLTIEDYCTSRHAALDFGGHTKSIVDAALDTSGRKRKVYVATSNSFALANFAAGTDLVATLPKRLQSSAFKGFSSHPPPLTLPMVTYDLVWHRRATDSSRHIWLRNIMKKTVSELEGSV
ncbi:LysR family transcriptional regulator [Roseobacter sp.]|uniref:LysR family transcriptional regulator n=1 Tax=Roseobacter sp. TaxID=1907202 RepID=UPI00385D06D4